MKMKEVSDMAYEHILETWLEDERKKNAELKREIRSLKSRKNALQRQVDQLKEANAEFIDKGDTPFTNEDAKRYREQAQKLLADKKRLQVTIDELKAENERLKNAPKLVRK